jgi:hypothetical protein
VFWLNGKRETALAVLGEMSRLSAAEAFAFLLELFLELRSKLCDPGDRIHFHGLAWRAALVLLTREYHLVICPSKSHSVFSILWMVKFHSWFESSDVTVERLSAGEVGYVQSNASKDRRV